MTHLEEAPIPPHGLGSSFPLYKMKSEGRGEAPSTVNSAAWSPFCPGRIRVHV